MVKKYTITLTDAENKALGIFAFDQNEWIQNVVHDRCRIAIDEIVNSEVQKLLAEGKTIPSSKDEIVLNSELESAAEVEKRIQEELKSLQG